MSEAAGHVPVLLDEALEVLRPGAGSLMLDGTFGAGGYSRALLDRGATVVALDRDPAAVRGGAALVAASGGRLRLLEARFGDMGAVAGAFGPERADGVVLDLGVSSMQLDVAERGFSFRFDAPLDMRMEGRDAARRTSCARRTRRPSPTSSFISARKGRPAASPAPLSPTGERRLSSRRSSSRAWWRASRPPVAASSSIPRHGPSRPCASP